MDFSIIFEKILHGGSNGYINGYFGFPSWHSFYVTMNARYYAIRCQMISDVFEMSATIFRYVFDKEVCCDLSSKTFAYWYAFYF